MYSFAIPFLLVCVFSVIIPIAIAVSRNGTCRECLIVSSETNSIQDELRFSTQPLIWRSLSNSQSPLFAPWYGSKMAEFWASINLAGLRIEHKMPGDDLLKLKYSVYYLDFNDVTASAFGSVNRIRTPNLRNFTPYPTKDHKKNFTQGTWLDFGIWELDIVTIYIMNHPSSCVKIPLGNPAAQPCVDATTDYWRGNINSCGDIINNVALDRFTSANFTLLRDPPFNNFVSQNFSFQQLPRTYWGPDSTYNSPKSYMDFPVMGFQLQSKLDQNKLVFLNGDDLKRLQPSSFSDPSKKDDDGNAVHYCCPLSHDFGEPVLPPSTDVASLTTLLKRTAGYPYTLLTVYTNYTTICFPRRLDPTYTPNLGIANDGYGICPPCKNGGYCLRNGRCKCPANFGDVDCSRPIPAGFGKPLFNMTCNDFDPCSGVGLCATVQVPCFQVTTGSCNNVLPGIHAQLPACDCYDQFMGSVSQSSLRNAAIQGLQSNPDSLELDSWTEIYANMFFCEDTVDFWNSSSFEIELYFLTHQCLYWAGNMDPVNWNTTVYTYLNGQPSAHSSHNVGYPFQCADHRPTGGELYGGLHCRQCPRCNTSNSACVDHDEENRVCRCFYNYGGDTCDVQICPRVQYDDLLQTRNTLACSAHHSPPSGTCLTVDSNTQPFNSTYLSHCHCESGYGGPQGACEIQLCPKDKNGTICGFGTCQQDTVSTGHCVCHQGWETDHTGACTLKICGQVNGIDCNAIKVSVYFAQALGAQVAEYFTNNSVCDRSVDPPQCRCWMGLTPNIDTNPSSITYGQDRPNDFHLKDGYYNGPLGACDKQYRDLCVPFGDNSTQMCSGHGRCIVCDNVLDPNCNREGPPHCVCDDLYQGTFCEQSICRQGANPVSTACQYQDPTTHNWLPTGTCTALCSSDDGKTKRFCTAGDPANTRLHGEAKCQCNALNNVSYIGDYCTIPAPSCYDKASGTTCNSPNGMCADDGTGTYICLCHYPYEGDTCGTINYCPGCNNNIGGDCLPKSGTFYCRCRNNYIGGNCTIERCASTGGSASPDGNSCSCPPGSVWTRPTDLSFVGCRKLCPYDSFQSECGPSSLTATTRCQPYIAANSAGSPACNCTTLDKEGRAMKLNTSTSVCMRNCEHCADGSTPGTCDVNSCDEKLSVPTAICQYFGPYCNQTHCNSKGTWDGSKCVCYSRLYDPATSCLKDFCSEVGGIVNQNGSACICPTPYVLDTDPKSKTYQLCISACVNGGTPVLSGGKGTCVCPKMYYGTFCEHTYCAAGSVATADGSACNCQLAQYQGTYCNETSCHMGTPKPPSAGTGCDCFPIWNDNATCSLSQCGPFGSPPTDPRQQNKDSKCICLPGYNDTYPGPGGWCSRNRCYPGIPGACNTASKPDIHCSFPDLYNYECDCTGAGFFDKRTGGCTSFLCVHGSIFTDPATSQRTCLCAKGWTGSDCTVANCPSDRETIRDYSIGCECIPPWSNFTIDCTDSETTCGKNTQGGPSKDSHTNDWMCNCATGFFQRAKDMKCVISCVLTNVVAFTDDTCTCNSNYTGVLCDQLIVLPSSSTTTTVPVWGWALIGTGVGAAVLGSIAAALWYFGLLGKVFPCIKTAATAAYKPL